MGFCFFKSTLTRGHFSPWSLVVQEAGRRSWDISAEKVCTGEMHVNFRTEIFIFIENCTER